MGHLGIPVGRVGRVVGQHERIARWTAHGAGDRGRDEGGAAGAGDADADVRTAAGGSTVGEAQAGIADGQLIGGQPGQAQGVTPPGF